MLGLQWRIPRPPPAPPPQYQPRSWAIDLTKICRSPDALAFAARRELLAVLGIGERRVGLLAPPSPAVSFERSRGPSHNNNCLIVILTCPGQSDEQRIACLACGCRTHAVHSLQNGLYLHHACEN